MQTLAQIRELLESRGLSPRKALGQNFLVDHNLIRKLVDAADVKPGHAVLEIGPGTGTLTEELLSRGCAVVACELDRGLAQLLRERFGTQGARSEGAQPHPQARFTLIQGDALASKRALNAEVVQAIEGKPFKLVANLPYGAATPVMIALLVEHPMCEAMYITIQREVADRLLAQPGMKEYGPLAVIAQAMADVRRIAQLPPECFWPRPDITSAMVAVVRRTRAAGDTRLEPEPDWRHIADAVQQLFSRRRKQLGSILGREFSFPQGINPESRVEALSVEQVLALTRKMG